MTAVSDETGGDWLPLKYEDGPDFCTVTLATGAAFALTVHPERMKLMEAALSASPVAQEPVAWVEFTERGAIRFWTNDPERAAHESQKRTLTEFSLSRLVALLGKQPSPVALMHIGKIDSIACSYAYCDDASLHTDMRHIHELATLARDVFYTSPAVAEKVARESSESPPPAVFSDPTPT